MCPIFDDSVDNFGQKENFLLVKDTANEKGNTVFELEFEPPVSSRCDSKLRLSGRKAASSLFHGQSRADKTDQYFLGVKQPQSLLVYLHGVQRKKQINNIRRALLRRAVMCTVHLWNFKFGTQN